MESWFHVSSRANRESIRAYGLDWTKMGAAPGIAGSATPEADGVFLCQEYHVEFFVRLNNTGGPVDVWAVSGEFEDQMIDNGSGFCYFPGRIPAAQVTLTEWPLPGPAPAGGPSRARKGQQKKPPRTRDRRRLSG